MIVKSQFLLTAVEHDYRFGTEDRLTQIVAAAYNSSSTFKKIFHNFLELPFKNEIKTTARTQVHGTKSRPDLVIYRENLNGGIGVSLAVIESKVHIKKASTKQVSSHDGKKKYLVVCHGDDSSRLPTGCKLKYWQDFAFQLQEYLTKNKNDKNTLERFILSNTLEYFKRTNMLRAQKITKNDFVNIEKFFLSIRNEKAPNCDIDRFMSSMKNFQEVCSQAIEQFSSSKFAQKRFVPKMTVSSWTNFDLKEGRRFLEIQKDLTFSKVWRNGVKRIFLSYMEKSTHKGMEFCIGAANRTFVWTDEHVRKIDISKGITVVQLRDIILDFYKTYEQKKRVYKRD